jgi:cytoplasmic tRNA 2-thiolation protein 2
MCSIGEDDFGDEGGAHTMLEDPKSIEIIDEICKKCNVDKSSIKVDFKNSMCELCFQHYVRHKFRATLGSTKIVRRDSQVLIDFSGSIENICLLHMIKFGLEQEKFKRLCIEPELIFIDENCCDENDLLTRFERIQEMVKLLTSLGDFKCYYTSISGSIGNKENIKTINEITLDSLKIIMRDEETFLKHFKTLKSLTAKQDFIVMSKNKILRDLASVMNIQYIFLSETSLTLASKLLTNISLGRGSSTAFDVAFCDDRDENLKIIRPIKDMSVVEIENYARLNNLNQVRQSLYGVNDGQFTSIQNLTSNFIEGLQKNYSSTVSTVFRTCSKIAPLTAKNIVDRCKMCHATIDYENSETLFAIELSRFVSEIAGNENDMKNTEKIESKASETLKGKNSPKKSLCHGCRNIFIGLDESELQEMNF